MLRSGKTIYTKIMIIIIIIILYNNNLYTKLSIKCVILDNKNYIEIFIPIVIIITRIIILYMYI